MTECIHWGGSMLKLPEARRLVITVHVQLGRRVCREQVKQLRRSPFEPWLLIIQTQLMEMGRPSW